MGQMKNNIETLFKEEEGTEEVRERGRKREEGGRKEHGEGREHQREATTDTRKPWAVNAEKPTELRSNWRVLGKTHQRAVDG